MSVRNLSEIIDTFVLVFAFGAIFSKEVSSHGIAAGLIRTLGSSLAARLQISTRASRRDLLAS
jgi:hypothetical protein